MFFRNLTFFRFPLSTPLQTIADPMDPDKLTLHSALEDCALKPVGPSELMSRGWVPPLGSGSEALFHQVGTALWITLGGEDRLLPSSVVNAELDKRLAAIEQAEGRRPGGRARKRLKEDVVMELLPRALVRPSRLNAYLDLDRGLLVVDTASRKAAENLVSELRQALGSFPALPLNAEVSVRAVLTSWLAGQTMGATGLMLGDEAELRDPVDGGGVVRLSHHELGVDEVEQHVEAGKQVTRLGLDYMERLAFTVGEDLVLRKVKFLDAALDALEGTETDGVAAELDARFALMSGEVGRLFDVLEGCFTFSKAEAAAPAPSVDEKDPLYDQAVEAVLASRSGSISKLQRMLKLGYNRAARLIEAMEAEGVLSGMDARGDRKVLRAKAEA